MCEQIACAAPPCRSCSTWSPRLTRVAWPSWSLVRAGRMAACRHARPTPLHGVRADTPVAVHTTPWPKTKTLFLIRVYPEYPTHTAGPRAAMPVGRGPRACICCRTCRCRAPRMPRSAGASCAPPLPGLPLPLPLPRAFGPRLPGVTAHCRHAAACPLERSFCFVCQPFPHAPRPERPLWHSLPCTCVSF